jgi:hypothetical protein
MPGAAHNEPRRSVPPCRVPHPAFPRPAEALGPVVPPRTAAGRPSRGAWMTSKPLAALWLVLISTVDPVELAVGAGASALTAFVARGARRAVTGR